MKGLLIKDLLYLRQMGRVLVIILVIYGAMFATAGATNLGSGAASIVVMLTMILTINAFAYDEKSNWDGFGLSLPINRKRMVLEKYLLVLLVSGSISLLLLAACLATGKFTAEDGVSIAAGFAMALLFPAVLIPLFYRFGTQSARLVIFLFVMIPVLFVVLWKRLNLPLPHITDAMVMQFLWLSPVLILALYVISFLISCAVYSKKEF